MNYNKINELSGSQWLQTKVQTIEGEMIHADISQRKYSTRKYQSLCKRLNFVSQKLENLEKTSDVFAKAQTEHLKEKVIRLSHDLIDRLVDREVTQIQEESTSLKKGKISSKAIKTLETHIHHLEKNYKPSIPHRRILADAKHALLEAKSKLESQPKVHHFDWLTQQIPVHCIEDLEILPGEVEELFDIAKAIYYQNFREAKARYLLLPEDHKGRFEKHMQHLMAKPFEDSMETIQSLIATANELVGNGEPYPTKDQIDQFFLGLSQVIEEEKREEKIFCLKSVQVG